jgi:hypothetical protein
VVRAGLGADVTAAVFLSFLVLFPVSFLGSKIDRALRIEVGKLARSAEGALASGQPGQVYRSIAAALALEFAVISAVLFCIIAGGSLVIDGIGRRLSPTTMKAFGIAFYVVPLLGVADTALSVPGRRGAMVFLGGLTVALAVGYFFVW